jgi:hypothetical protein
MTRLALAVAIILAFPLAAKSDDEFPQENSLPANTSVECETDSPDAPSLDEPSSRRSRKLFDRRTVLLSGAMLAAVPVGGYLVWWRGKDLTNFRVEQEGWFGPDGYAGGADKAGHLYATALAGDLMQRFYVRLGHTPSDARWLSIGAVTIGGLLIEAGDGFKYGGASPEDVAMNIAGAILGAQIAFHGRENLLGLRYGQVSNPRQPRDGPPLEHYSREISAFDFKFAGLTGTPLSRGPGRFLMLSLTYGSTGYRELPPDERERNVGLELGLNLPEILRWARVPEDGLWWWVHALFRFVRVPFTAIGWHYDLDHSRWHGPSTR